jgi:hypothetical protein
MTPQVRHDPAYALEAAAITVLIIIAVALMALSA